MTVSITLSKNIYIGNGTAKEWPFNFPVLDASHIAVYITDTKDVISKLDTSLYKVDMESKVVLYPLKDQNTLPKGWKITINRETPNTQLTDLINQGPFFAEVIEEALDKATMIAQQLAEQQERSVQVPIDQEGGGDKFFEQIIQARNDAQSAASTAAADTAAIITKDMQGYVAGAIDAKNQAQAAATAANTSAGGASTSANNAAKSATAAAASASTASTKAGEASASAASALNSKNYAAISEGNALGAESGAKQAEQSAANSSGNAEYWGRKAAEYADAMKPEHIALLVGTWSTTLANEILEARLLGYNGTTGNTNLEAVLAGDFMPAAGLAIPYAQLNNMLENRLPDSIPATAKTIWR